MASSNAALVLRILLLLKSGALTSLMLKLTAIEYTPRCDCGPAVSHLDFLVLKFEFNVCSK